MSHQRHKHQDDSSTIFRSEKEEEERKKDNERFKPVKKGGKKTGKRQREDTQPMLFNRTLFIGILLQDDTIDLESSSEVVEVIEISDDEDEDDSSHYTTSLQSPVVQTGQETSTPNKNKRNVSVVIGGMEMETEETTMKTPETAAAERFPLYPQPQDELQDEFHRTNDSIDGGGQGQEQGGTENEVNGQNRAASADSAISSCNMSQNNKSQHSNRVEEEEEEEERTSGDEDEESGEEADDDSDLEDNISSILEQSGSKRAKVEPHDLPETCTVLKSESGATVYLVGTAHFSEESQEDVAKTIQRVQPDVVMLELCKSRMNILHLDEKTIMEESKNMTMERMVATLRQNGTVQGTMYLLLLSMSAHLTKELGMAPGGEFRRAFKEAQKIPGCLVHLGDRPIGVTLKRALASLSLWQKVRLAFNILTSKDTITKEDVEKCKEKDILESMLEEMAG